MSALLLLLVAMYAVVFAKPVEWSSVFYFKREEMKDDTDESSQEWNRASQEEVKGSQEEQSDKTSKKQATSKSLSKEEAQDIASDIIHTFIGR